MAELHFADGCCCCVVFDDHRHGQDVSEQGADVDVRPDAVGVGAIGDGHAAQVVGDADADADQAVDIDCTCGHDLVDLGPKKGDDFFGHGEVDFAADASADVADEVEGNDGDMVAVDIETDGKGAVRIDDQLGRRLSTAAKLTAGLEDQAVIEQALGDVGDGRCSQARQLGDFGTGNRRTCGAHGLKRHALIVITGAFEVCAGQ